MNVYILNKAFEMVGVIDDYSSLIWAERYWNAGEFEIMIRANEEMISLLKEDCYVVREDKITKQGFGEVGIIENKEIKTDEDSGSYLTVKGNLLDGILDRRIVWNQTTISGNAEECIRKLIEDNIILPTDQERKIENFILDKKQGFTEEIKEFDLQSAGDDLLEAISSICQNAKIGFQMTLTTEHKFLFTLYKGVDRSRGQQVNDFVVFSPEYDNLNNTEYTFNREEYKNAGLIFGEGEGASQKVVSIGDTTGLDRREVKIDGSSVSSNGEIITMDTYERMLRDYGNGQMNEHKQLEGMAGDVENNFTYKINVDYFIGDIVSVENEFKIGANTRVIETAENWSETGYQIVPTFDTWEVIQ